MPDSHTDVYLHLVWATVGRQPLLTGVVRDTVFRCIRAECKEMHVEVVALDGIEDHVHLLVRCTATRTIAGLMKQIKGSTSHLVRNTGLHEGFGWQEGYSAFSVSRWDVPKIRDYIARQREHHTEGTMKAALERPALPT